MDPIISENSISWEKFINKYQTGDIVEGTVVAQDVFGYLVNIGEPFLAFVDVALTKKNETFPKNGSKVHGKVLMFTKDNKQMRILPVF